MQFLIDIYAGQVINGGRGEKGMSVRIDLGNVRDSGTNVERMSGGGECPGECVEANYYT